MKANEENTILNNITRKMFNVVKYLVLIFAFLFVGMVGSQERAMGAFPSTTGCNRFKGSDASCKTAHVTESQIRIHSSVNKDWLGFYIWHSDYHYFRICDYRSSTSNCVTIDTINLNAKDTPINSNAESPYVIADKITATDIRIDRNGKAYYEFKTKKTGLSSMVYLDGTVMKLINYEGSSYQKKGFTLWSVATQSSSNADIDTSAYSFGVDVPAYYFNAVPTSNGIKISSNRNSYWGASHTMTVNAGIPNVSKIEYFISSCTSKTSCTTHDWKNVHGTISNNSPFTPTGGQDGYYRFNVRVTSTLGETATNYKDFGIDAGSPYFKWIDIDGDTSFGLVSQYAQSRTVRMSIIDSYSGIKSVTCGFENVENGETPGCSASRVSGTNYYDIKTPSGYSGALKLDVIVVDGAGNKFTTVGRSGDYTNNASVGVSLDNTKPDVVVGTNPITNTLTQAKFYVTEEHSGVKSCVYTAEYYNSEEKTKRENVSCSVTVETSTGKQRVLISTSTVADDLVITITITDKSGLSVTKTFNDFKDIDHVKPKIDWDTLKVDGKDPEEAIYAKNHTFSVVIVEPNVKSSYYYFKDVKTDKLATDSGNDTSISVTNNKPGENEPTVISTETSSIHNNMNTESNEGKYKLCIYIEDYSGQKINSCSPDEVYFDNYQGKASEVSTTINGVSSSSVGVFGPNSDIETTVTIYDVQKVKETIDINKINVTPTGFTCEQIQKEYEITSTKKFVKIYITFTDCNGKANQETKGVFATINLSSITDEAGNSLEGKDENGYCGDLKCNSLSSVYMFELDWDGKADEVKDIVDAYATVNPRIYSTGETFYITLLFNDGINYKGEATANVCFIENGDACGNTETIKLDMEMPFDAVSPSFRLVGYLKVTDSHKGMLKVLSISGELTDLAGNDVIYPESLKGIVENVYFNIEGPKIIEEESKIETYLGGYKFNEMQLGSEEQLPYSSNLSLKITLSMELFVPTGTNEEKVMDYYSKDLSLFEFFTKNEETLNIVGLTTVKEQIDVDKIEGYIAFVKIEYEIGAGTSYVALRVAENYIQENQSWRVNGENKGTALIEGYFDTKEDNSNFIYNNASYNEETGNLEIKYDGSKSAKQAIITYDSNPENGYYVYSDEEDVFVLVDNRDYNYCYLLGGEGYYCNQRDNDVLITGTSVVDTREIQIKEVYDKYGNSYLDSEATITINYFDSAFEVTVNEWVQAWIEYDKNSESYKLFVEESYASDNATREIEITIKLSSGTLKSSEELVNGSLLTEASYEGGVQVQVSALYDHVENGARLSYTVYLSDGITELELNIDTYLYDTNEISLEKCDDTRGTNCGSSSIPLESKGLYKKEFKVVYGIIDNNDNRPKTYSYKEGVEALPLKVFTYADKNKAVEFVYAVGETTDSKIQGFIVVTIRLDNKAYATARTLEINLASENLLSSATNMRIGNLSIGDYDYSGSFVVGTLNIYNTATVYIPVKDNTGKIELGYSMTNKDYVYDVTGLSQPQSVYFNKYGWDTSSESHIVTQEEHELKNEDGQYKVSFAKSSDGVAEDTTFVYSIGEDSYGPKVIVINGPYSYDAKVATCGNETITKISNEGSFCYKIWIFDNWQYGLKIELGNYETDDVKLVVTSITDTGLEMMYGEDSGEVARPWGRQFALVFTYNKNNNNAVSIGSDEILNEVLGVEVLEDGKNKINNIKDISNQVAIYDETIPTGEIQFIPEELKLEEQEAGEAGKSVYSKIEVILGFNRKVTEVSNARVEYGDGKSGVCEVSEGKLRCTLEENAANISKFTFKADSISDEYGVTTEKFEEELKIFEGQLVTIDAGGPKITYAGSTETQYINGKSDIRLKFKVEDSNFDSSNYGGPTISVVGEKAGICTVKSKEISGERGVYYVTYTVGSCSGVGKLSYTFAKGVYKDSAGNESELTTGETNYEVNDNSEAFAYASHESEKGILSSKDTSVTKTVTIKYNREIGSYNSSLITLEGGSSRIKGIETDESDKTELVITITAAYGSMNGPVVVTLNEGAVRDVYGNEALSEEIITDIEILNGDFTIKVKANVASGCNKIGDSYYCKEGATITFTATMDREAIGSTSVRINLNGTPMILVGLKSGNTYTYTYTVKKEEVNSDNGFISVSEYNYGDLKDEAGNIGKVETDYSVLDKITIDTVAPTFKNTNWAYNVKLGEQYNSAYICNYFNGDSTNNTCSVTSEELDFVNSNGLYDGALGQHELELKLVDKAGNEASATVKVNIQNEATIKVKFNNKTDTYDTMYIFDSAKDVEVTIPQILQSVVTEADVKEAIGKMLSLQRIVYNAGEYTIGLTSNTIVVGETSIGLEIETGEYIVNQKEIYLSDYTITVEDKVYDGNTNLSKDKIIITVKAGKIDRSSKIEIGYAYYASANAGEAVGYTIEGIRSNSANYVIKTSSYGGTGRITKKEINSSVIDNISKFADGSKGVEQDSYYYVDSALGNRILVSWSKGEYASSGVGKDIVVTLTGLMVDNSNYEIKGNTTKGEIVATTGGIRVTYDSEKEIYTNASSYEINVISVEDGVDGQGATHKWCESKAKVTENHCSSASTGETKYTVALEEDGVYYVYHVVTNASGESEVNEFTIYRNSEFRAVSIKLITESEEETVVYGANQYIYVYLNLTSKIKDSGLENVKLNLESSNGNEYEFDYDSLETYEYEGIQASKIVFIHKVSGTEKLYGPDLVYSSVVGLNRVVDLYGNTFSNGAVGKEGKTITIDARAGVLSDVSYEVNDKKLEDGESVYYIKANTEVKLELILTFENKLSATQQMTKVVVNGNELTCSKTSDYKMTCVKSDFSSEAGEAEIEYFGNKLDADSQTVLFDSANKLVLNSTYVSEHLLVSNGVIIDGEGLEIEFIPEKEEVSSSVEVEVRFNKEYVDKNICEEACKDLFEITDGDDLVNEENNVSVSYNKDTNKLTVSYSGRERVALTFTLKEGNGIEDKVGNEATSEGFKVTFDGRGLEAEVEEIVGVGDSCIEVTEGEEKKTVCGKESEVRVEVGFNREIVKVSSATITYTIGSSSGNKGYETVENGKIIFVVPIETENGVFVLSGLVYKVEDALGNEIEVSESELEAETSKVEIDTNGVEIEDENVVADKETITKGDFIFKVSLNEEVRYDVSKFSLVDSNGDTYKYAKVWDVSQKEDYTLVVSVSVEYVETREEEYISLKIYKEGIVDRVNNIMGADYVSSASVDISNDVGGASIEADESNRYTYGKSSEAREGLTLKYKVRDESELEFKETEGFSYADGVLTYTYTIGANFEGEIRVVIPKDILTDEHGNTLDEEIVEKVIVVNSPVVILSSDVEVEGKYYTKEGEVKLLIRSLDGKAIEEVTCASGYECSYKNGEVEVKKREKITGDVDIEFEIDAFMVKLYGDSNSYGTAGVKFEYKLDNSAPEVSSIKVNGKEYSEEGYYVKGRVIPVEVTFSEEINELPTLKAYYGEELKTTLLTGKVIGNKAYYDLLIEDGSGKINFGFDNVEDKLGNVQDIAKTSDSKVEVVGKVVVSEVEISSTTCNSNKGIYYCKEGKSVVVTISFSSAVKGSAPILDMYFGGIRALGAMSVSEVKEAGVSEITYTYTVTNKDSGQLTELRLRNGELVDVRVSNVVELTLPEYATNVEVDNKEYVVTLTPRESKVKGSVVYDYVCNKEEALCDLSDAIEAKVGEESVTVEVDAINKTVTVRGLEESGKVVISLISNKIYDYAGNAGRIEVEGEVEVDAESIGVIGVEVTGSGNCNAAKCGSGGKIIVALRFNDTIKEREEGLKLNAKIGEKAIEMSLDAFSSNGDKLVFTYLIKEGESGELSLVSLSSTAIKDELGNELGEASLSSFEVEFEVDAKGPEAPSIKVEANCSNEVCSNGDQISFEVTFNEDIELYSIVIETNYGKLEVVDKSIGARKVVTLYMEIAGSGDGELSISKVSGSYYDVFGNKSEYAQTSDYEIEKGTIEVDNTKPTVGGLSLEENYNKDSEAEEIEITVSEEAIVDETKVCIRKEGSSTCTYRSEEYVSYKYEEEKHKIIVSFAKLSGTYRVVLEKGFVKDKAGLENEEITSGEFQVSSDKDTIEIAGIKGSNVENEGKYYLKSNGSIRFNIEAVDSEGNVEAYVGSNACEYIKYYRVEDGAEVEDIFECFAHEVEDVEIRVKDGAEKGKYYFVIDGEIMKNEYGNASNSYSSSELVIVNDELEETGREKHIEEVVEREEGNGTTVYIIKARSIDITFKFNNDIKEYEKNGVVVKAGRSVIRFDGLKDGETYSLVFRDYYNNEIRIKVEVYRDEKAPVIETSNRYVNNYVGSKEIELEFTCTDTGNNGEEYSSSGVDCSSREVEVYKGENKLEEGIDYSIDEEKKKITLLKEVSEGEKYRVEYKVRDGLGKEGKGSAEFIIDVTAPEIKVSINKSPVKRSELKATVEVVESGSKLANREISYRFVNQANNEIVYTGKVTLDNSNKAEILGEAIEVEGNYKLLIDEISDNVGRVDSHTADESSVIVVDDSAAEFDRIVRMEGCNELNCKAEAEIEAKIKFKEKIKSIEITSEWFSINGVEINNDEVSFTLRVLSNASSSDKVNIKVETVDEAGNKNDNKIEIELTNVIVDTSNDFSALVVGLDNDYKKNPTKISKIEITDEGKSEVSKITYKVGEEEKTLEELMAYEFKGARTVVRVEVEDKAGNKGSKEEVIEVDVVKARVERVEIKEGSYDLSNVSYTFSSKVKVIVHSSDSDVVGYLVRLGEREEGEEFVSLRNEGREEESYYNVNSKENEIVLERGENTIYVYLLDKAGNISEAYERKITYIALEIEDHQAGDKGKTYNKYDVSIKGLLVDKYSFKITYGVLKQEDSIYEQAYSKDILVKEETTRITETLEGKNGVYKFISRVSVINGVDKYYAILDVENIKIDTKLEIIAEPSRSDEQEAWVREEEGREVSVTVSDDEESAIEGEVQAFINSNYETVEGAECRVEGKLVIKCNIKENGVYRIKVEDEAGNEDHTNQFIITKIDAGKGYEIVLEADEENYKREHIVKVTIKKSEGGAPVANSGALYLLTQKEGITTETFMEEYNTVDGAKLNEREEVQGIVVGSGKNGLYYLYVYVKDEAGVARIEKVSIKLDNEGPEVEFVEGYFKEEYARYESLSQVIKVEDTVGINEIKIVFKQGEEEIELDANDIESLKKLEGRYQITVKACDKLGNCNGEGKVSEKELWIDNKVSEPERTNPQAYFATPNYKVRDIGSGIDKVWYCVVDKEEELQECEYNEGNNVVLGEERDFDVEVQTSASHVIGIRVRDKVGNYKDYKYTFTYDDVYPEVGYEIRLSDNYVFSESDYSEEEGTIILNKLTNKDVYIKIYDIKDEISGLKCWYVVYASDRIIGKEGYNNCEQSEVSYEGIETYDVSNTVNSIDKYTEYRISGDFINTEAKDNRVYVNVYAVDNAGNEVSKVFVVGNINNKEIKYTLELETTGAVTKTNIEIKDLNIDEEKVAITYRRGEIFAGYDSYNSEKIYNLENQEKYESMCGEGVVNKEAICSFAGGEAKEGSLENEITENGLYVFRIVDEWGNETYKRIAVTNLDSDAPELPEEITLEAESKNAYVLEGLTYEKLEEGLVIEGQYIIYKDVLKVRIPAFEDKGAAKVRVRVCYEAESRCEERELGANSENTYTVDEKYSGKITISLVDSAGNESENKVRVEVTYYGENTLTGVSVTDTLTNLSSWYKDKTIGYTVVAEAAEGNTIPNRFAAIRYYMRKVSKEVETYTEEVEICDSGWMSNKEGSYKITCSGEMDGEYEIVYKLKDILGNENEEVIVKRVYVDTVLPVYEETMMDFGFVGSNGKYALKYTINGSMIEDVYSVIIKDKTGSEYCAIDARGEKEGVCSEIESDLYEEETQYDEEGNEKKIKTFKYTVVLVDKAGNESAGHELSETYNEERAIFATSSYEVSTKTVTITVYVKDASGVINKVEVRDGETVIRDLAQGNTNTTYTLAINTTNYAGLFSNGIIDKKLVIEVHDSYETPKIGEIELDIYYDTRDIEIEHLESEPSITTLNGDNELAFTSNKELNVGEAGARYILQRVSGATLSTVTKENFATTYDRCQKDKNSCARGEIEYKEGRYVYTIEKSESLLSAQYRVTIYGKDKYGHDILDNDLYVNIDNSKPMITYSRLEVDINEYYEGKEVDVFSGNVTVTISDKQISGEIWYASALRNVEITKIASGEKIANECAGKESCSVVLGDYVTGEGYFYIKAEDKEGNVTEKYILVDKENTGMNIYLDGEQLLEDMTFNRDRLEKVSMKLNEEMRSVKYDFYASTTKVVSIELYRDGSSVICYFGSCRYDKKHEFDLRDIEGKVEIEEVLDFAGVIEELKEEGVEYTTSVEALSGKIGKLTITTNNLSNISKSKDMILDFIKPEILTKKKNAYYGADRKYLSECGERCYKLEVNVVTEEDKYVAANKLRELVGWYIVQADGQNYDNIKGRIRVIYSEEESFNADTDSWIDYNILDVVGEYEIRFVYTDLAGNESEEEKLIVEVKDDEVPGIKFNFNNSSNNTSINLQIKKDTQAIYKDEGVTGEDSYGFDALGKEKTTKEYSLEYSIDVNGYKAMEMKENKLVFEGEEYARYDSESKVYTFNKAGNYKFKYTVKDYKGNIKSIELAINVSDGNTPDIIDKNIIEIKEENLVKYMEINGVRYAIEEVEGLVVWLKYGDNERIEVEDSKFVINGVEYTIEGNKVKISGFNINDALVCFEAKEGCKHELKEIEAEDREDGKRTRVVVKEIKYKETKEATTWKNLQNYEIEREEAGLFEIKSIKFKNVGYYRIVLRSSDSKGNYTDVEYIIRIYDETAPEIEIVEEGEREEVIRGAEGVVEVEEGKYIKNVYYSEEFKAEYKVNGVGTIEKWIEKWAKDSNNVKVSHNYEGDKHIGHVVSQAEEVEVEEREEYEYGRYKVEITSIDSSGNIGKIELVVYILDKEAPEMGEIKFSYNENMSGQIEVAGKEVINTNAEELYFKIEGGRDTSDMFHYEYVICEGECVDNPEWKVYEGVTRAYLYESGVSNDVVVRYKAVDRVGNETEERESVVFAFDNDKPEYELTTAKEVEGEIEVEYIESGEIYHDEGKVQIEFRDDSGRVKVWKYVNNAEVLKEVEYINGQYIEDSEFGHYKYVIRDIGGNEVVVEYIILPADNKFVQIDNKSLDKANEASEVEITFDEIVIQKLSDKNRFHFEDMSIIGDRDMVYLMGVVPDKKGAIFSIYKSGGLSGAAFKQYTSYFAINTTSNITNTNPEYRAPDDYLINFEGEQYIIIGIIRNAAGETEDNNEINEEKREEKKSSMTWLLYVVGVVGVLGGGFLVMKLKRRIRAA